MIFRRAKCVTVLALMGVAILTGARPAVAGCGCDKPPPPPAEVRPSAAYAGLPISFFSPGFQVGQTYAVTFASGISGQAAVVNGQVVSRRDLADGVYKPQLVVPLPALSLGPVSIVVTDPASGGEVAFVPDTEFTAVPNPIVVPGQAGTYSFQNYQAAVDRAGVLYVALDLTNVVAPLVVDAQANGYALRFNAAGVSFHNAQGFLMQTLMSGTQPIPGMYVLPAAGTAASPNFSPNSDILHYSRHEFETYFLQHQERLPHATDPADGNWHLDGTRHVDHNHLILAIAGALNGGVLPAPGATAPLTMSLKAYSLFYQGLVGAGSVEFSGKALADSYSASTMVYGANGDVFTNGKIKMDSGSTINGNATAAIFNLSGTAAITGTWTPIGTPQTFMSVKIPPGLPSLGKIMISSSTYKISGPGSFLVGQIALNNGATLYIDNSAGPVTLYVSGDVAVNSPSRILTADPNPEKFGVYMTGSNGVTLSGGGAAFHGVVYAPQSNVNVSNGDFYGAFVGNKVGVTGGGKAHYEESLRGQ